MLACTGNIIVNFTESYCNNALLIFTLSLQFFEINQEGKKWGKAIPDAKIK